MYSTQAAVVMVKPPGTFSGAQYPGHLGEIGAFVAEQLPHLGGAVLEWIHPSQWLWWERSNPSATHRNCPCLDIGMPN